MADLGRNETCRCGSGRKYKKCCLDTDREIARGDRPKLTIDGSNSPQVENGHIVPRMYQRAWEIQGRKVAVHVDGSCRVKSTKRVGTRGAYYRRTRPQGEAIDDIEKSLAHIEDKAAAPLRQLIVGGEVEAERKGIMAQLLAVQLMRGPAFFEQREEVIRPTFEGAKAEDFRPQAVASVGGDVNVVRQEAIAAELGPTKRFITMLAYAKKIASVLGLMRWQILRFEGPVLAYSDHPVVLWPLSIESTEPFRRQALGPLETLEICLPIAPDAAILMNWLDRSDEVGLQMPASAAAQLNAFVVSQAEKEWMHQPGSEPKIGAGNFRPLTKLIDASYGKQAALNSTRHALAAQFVKSVRGRQFVNGVKVLVEVGAGSAPQRAFGN